MANSAVTAADIEVVISYRVEGDVTKEANKAKKALQSVGKGAKDGEKDTNKFLASIKRIAGYRLLRTALKEITSGFKEGATNALLWEKATGNSRYLTIMSQLNGKLLELKNSLGSMIMPLLGAITPIITGVANALINVANIINQVTSALAGSATYLKANVLSNYDYAKSLNSVKRQLLGFDELNVLNGDSSYGGIAVENLFTETKINNKMGDLAGFFNEANAIIKENLDKIKKVILAAPLAIGALLACTGAAPLGLGLIALGAAAWAADAMINTEFVPNLIGTVLSNISKLLGVAGVAIGLLIACLVPTSMPVGLALLISGIATTAGAVVLGDGTKPVKERLTGLMVALGSSLLAVGAILAITGVNLPLGLGLMVAGAASLGSAVAINWESIVNSMKGTVGKITAILSGCLLGVGALLAFSGANIPLGIGLMLAGSAGLASVVAINWNAITEKFESVINSIKEKIQAVIDWYEGTSLYKWLHGGDAESYKSIKESQGLGYGLGYGYMYGGNYANGGIPSQGSMFIAGETGDPEFVGNVGGRTSVYNSDQLASSMASANENVVSAIYQAVNLINSAIANQPTPSIKIGDREIYQASQRGKTIVGRSLIQGV